MARYKYIRIDQDTGKCEYSNDGIQWYTYEEGLSLFDTFSEALKPDIKEKIEAESYTERTKLEKKYKDMDLDID